MSAVPEHLTLEEAPFGTYYEDIVWLREVQAYLSRRTPKEVIAADLADEVVKSDLLTPPDEDVAIVLWAFEVLNRKDN